MKNIKKTLVVLILCSFILGTIPVSVLAQQNSPENQIFEYEGPDLPDGVEYVLGEFIVKFEPGVSNKEIANINSKHGTSVIYTSPYAGFKRLNVPKGKSVVDMVEKYNRNPNVEYAVVNSIAHAFVTPNDPLYELQWHIDNDKYGGINVEAAWDISDGTGVIVAVLDSGVAYEDYEGYMQAPDLENTHFVAGYDFVNDDPHPNDDHSHGTHVTGTIAQSTNNGIGVAGVAYNCSIMPVKVLNENGSGTLDQLVDGIYYATYGGAKVISMSLGWYPGYYPGDSLITALDHAYENGVTIVCASGNDRMGVISYPAAYEKCIAVGATTYDEKRAVYSNYGDGLDIMAPGGYVYADKNRDGYGDGVLQNTFNPVNKDPTDFGYWFFQGTSMAAPHVSSVAALLISAGIATTPDEVREVLQSTAEDKGSAGWDPQYGYGIVDAYAALNYASAPNEPPTADTGGLYSGDEGAAISFDGSNSYDPNGSIVSYDWSFGDGNTGTGINPIHTYDQNGTYIVNLTVTDNHGDVDTNTTIATISDTGPEADFTATPTSGQEPLTVSFTDTSSTNDGISAWEWDFNDDGTIDDYTQNPVYVYAQNGTYNVNLTVYEADGDSNTITKIDHITVTTEVTEVKELPTMHVESIVMSISKWGVFTRASALVTVVNANDGWVEDAMVAGQWSEATNDIDSGVTDANGQVLLYSNTVKKAPSGTNFTFTVGNVTHSVFTYNATANVEDQDYIIVP